ncbi:MAG TPA: FAD-dependent oxidoreductase [Beijerinckiaceae bacterium]|nr:FAD-dependent oxidoreductase [Beijerinckiaceae bacterium]
MTDLSRCGNDCDIAVIGGGVVGLSVAYGLAMRGQAVTLLDEGDVAYRASRGNFALVWVQGKGIDLPDYARWTLGSASAWKGFAETLQRDSGINVALEQRGGLMACLSEEEQEERAAQLQRLHNAAPDSATVEMLDHQQMKALLPEIGSEVVGGTYCRLDGHVNALRLFRALHQACIGRGIAYRPNATVESLMPAADGFRIVTSAGEFRARKVVLAAGLGNATLAPMVGLSAPVRPQRGQVIVTEKLAPFLHYPLGTIRQTDEGGVMLGDSKEEVGFDTGNSHQVLGQIAAHAVKVFPLLARAQIVRSWGALRVMSPDGYPVYDRSTGSPGAYLVTCHSGVTLAAAHASVMAEAIASDIWPEAIAAFSARRFGDVPAAA